MALDTIPKQEGGKLKAVASGTLPSGQPVIVNADGTVSVVALNDVSDSVGSEAVFNSGNSNNMDAAYDAASGKVVVCYADGTIGGDGTAVVGTVSGTSISFGTPVIFEASNSTLENRMIYDANAGKVVIVFQDNSGGAYGQGKAIVGTVSGTSISFGTKVAITSGQTMENFGIAYDSNAQKIAISFRDYTGSNYGACVVGTVSGTSISFGSKVVFNSAVTIKQGMTYDSTAQKIVIAYYDYGATQGNARVGTISGTSISFGSEATFESAQVDFVNCSYNASADRTVVAYQDAGNSNVITAAVGTVSGTSISFGTPVAFDGAVNTFIGMAYDPNIGKTIIAYQDDGNGGRGTVVTGTVSGTSITFDTPFVFDNGSSGITQITAHLPIVGNKAVISYRDDSDSDKGTSVVFRPAGQEANLTSENYIGMSSGVVAVDSQTEDIGSAVVFNNTGNTSKPHLCFDTNSNKVVIGFVDVAVSEKGTAIVGTVSGTSISFGSETVYETSVTDFPAMVYDSSNNKVIVAYQDEGNTDYGTVAVGTVSGTSISFGTPVVFESAAVQHVALAFDSNSNKVVVSYSDHGNSEHGTAIVGTVSGTSISFGSAAVFESAQTARVSSTFDSSNNKVVIAYRTTTGKAVVATVSGTSISFGTPVEFYNALTDELDIIFDSNADKVVIGYQSSGSDAGLAKVGTVSGTSISFGAEATFESANVASISPVFDSNINKVVLAYSDVGNSRYGTYAVGTISGTDITFGTPSVFASVDTRSQVGAVFDTTSNKVVLAYRDDSNSSYGTSVVMVPGYTDITRGQVASGGAATVDIVGTVSTNQSSLTAGQQYFVQTDGTLGLTAADPSVLAGTAISATKLIVKT
jgi:hypothetical protein